MRGEQPILAFNRGLISRLAMARVDLKRYPMSAEVQTNFMPRVLGSAMLRPGLGYLGSVLDDAPARFLDFVFAADDTALLELTDGNMRVWVNDELVTRPAVSTLTTNGTFDADLSGWTDIDGTGAVSQWVTGGHLGLTGRGGNAAGRRQAVTVATADRGVQHGLRVVVARGLVDVLVGTSAGSESYFRVTLGPGTHSLAFTPAGDFSVDVVSRSPYEALVSRLTIDQAGALSILTPWTEDLLPYVRKDQSGDVLFVSCAGLQQHRIERRGTTSWSVVLYECDKGPLRPINTSATTISNTLVSGTTTLLSSAPVFKQGHAGAIFRLDSKGQFVEQSFTGTSEFSGKILVTGVGDTRAFKIVRTGAFTATLTLQRSVGDTGVWEDTTNTYTAAGSTDFNDGLNNEIIAYRLACTSYTPSVIAVGQLRYSYGSISGYVRITEVQDTTTATAVVLSALGAVGSLGNSATTNWYEGAWSDYRGWPSAVALYEGHLWWAGKDKWYGSVSDDFANFDPEFEGDAGPISRSIGSGPVDVINWLLPMQRLMAGTDGSIIAGRSNTLDEPLTGTNFNPKAAVTQGSARIPGVKIDDTGVFVQSGGYRVLSLIQTDASSYGIEDLSQLAPDIGASGIVALSIQRQPDTRIHAVRSNGTAAVMIYDKSEDVKCWIEVETDGSIEDAIVMPGVGGEDAVYYLVRRTINGGTKRYLERWAPEREAIGGAVSKIADSFIEYDGGNLTHLEGRAVVGWYSGVAYADPVIVIDGMAAGIPIGAIVGLPYEGRFKSTRLAFLAQPGESGLSKKKRVHSLAVVLADTHPKALQYGKDFDTMDSMPLMDRFAEVDQDAMWTAYNGEAFSFSGEWEVDSHLCLKATAPYPCTLLAAIPAMESHGTS